MRYMLLLAGVVAVALPAALWAQGEGCVTADCHPTIGKGTWVHGPVGAGICTVCHTQPDTDKHEFQFAAEKDELCFACHESSRDMMLEDHLHTPVAEGNCVGCHSPHQSEFRFNLKGQARDLCFQCHEQEPFQKAVVHGPVAVGDCNACHNPHASPYDKQLLADSEQLCFRCHEELSGIPEFRHQHFPVKDSCTNCHNPHSNEKSFLLGMEPPELCMDCHTELEEYADADTPHPPFAAGDCMECHSVHGSDNPKMFPVAANELCFTCHTDLGEYVSAQTHFHGPMKEGDCSACHDPHGSSNHRILKKYFPEEFYIPYDEANYAMCFECHNSQVAKEEHTTTLTDFRNGDLNLHYLHVNKTEKGRSCRACHQVHASSQEKHVRTSVPYGKIDWELPVEFTKTENGGSCVVGCHSPKEYSR